MLRACLLAFTLLTASLAIAPAADPDPVAPALREKIVAEIVKAATRRAEAAKKETEKTALLPNAKAGVIDAKVKDVTIPATIDKANPVRFPSAAAKKKYVTDLEAELVQLREFGKLPAKVPADFVSRLRNFDAGSFGYVVERQKVVKVIDKDSAVVKIILPTTAAGAAKDEYPTATVVVSGVDTSKWADDTGATLPKEVYVVAGNKKVGSTTYLHLVVMKFTDDEAKEIAKAAKP